MARPIKNNADYFPHETGMRNDRRIKSLRKRHGAEAYGIYCMMLEVLTDSQGLQVELTDIERQLIVDDFDISTDKFNTVLDAILELRLFQLNDNNMLTCKSLDSRLEPVFSKRERSLPVIRGFLGVSDAETTQNDDINTHSREKKRKEKKSKGEKKKATPRFAPPQLSEVIEYFTQKGDTELEAKRFYSYYDSNGWMVGKNKMQKWKSAASGWILRAKPEQQKSSSAADSYKRLSGWKKGEVRK